MLLSDDAVSKIQHEFNEAVNQKVSILTPGSNKGNTQYQSKIAAYEECQSILRNALQRVYYQTGL